MKDSSRQSFLGSESDALLARLRVAIVGLCGGGSHVAQQLAHIGVGHFVLCDPDIVEPSNLNRMVGAAASDADSGQAKVDVIAQRICAVNPHAKILRCQGRWQQHAIELRDVAAVFGCVDSYVERAQLETMCRRFLIPYIDIGVDVTKTKVGYAISGQVIVSMPWHPCMRCIGFLTDELLSAEGQHYGAAGGKPQVVWPNGVLASTAVSKFISIVLPWQRAIPAALITEYDGNTNQLFASNRLRHLPPDRCRHFDGLQDLGDPFFSL